MLCHLFLVQQSYSGDKLHYGRGEKAKALQIKNKLVLLTAFLSLTGDGPPQLQARVSSATEAASFHIRLVVEMQAASMQRKWHCQKQMKKPRGALQEEEV